VTLYEDSPGYFYDDSHKKWSLFKENNGQWRLEDLANDTRSDHPSFGAAVSALKSHVGDVTVHRKQARMPPIKTAVIKLAQTNPEFRKALVAELRTAGTPSPELEAIHTEAKRAVRKWNLPEGFKEIYIGKPQPRGVSFQAIRKKKGFLPFWIQIEDGKFQVSDSDHHSQSLPLTTPPAKVLAKLWSMQRRILQSEGLKAASDKQADKWEKKPKGWTDESRKKFWESLTSAAPKHKVTECIKRMNKHMGGNAGAFCASLADRVMPGWRQEAAKDRAKKGSSLTQPLSLRRDYGAGSDQDEWMDVEEVRKHCPPCADKMARNNIRRVKASVLRVAMQR